MNILIIDDHELFSEGLRLIIEAMQTEREFNIKIIESELKAKEFVNKSEVDLILLDYYLPGVDNKVFLEELRELYRNSEIVIVSSEESSQIIDSVMSKGISGFIPKSSSRDVMIAALELVLSGGTYFPPQMFKQFEAESEASKTLTQRQKTVLSLAAKGLSNKVIAYELAIAEGTVKAHLFTIFKELGVSNRTEAVLLATKEGLNT